MQQQALGARGASVAAKSVLAVVLAVALTAPVPAFADTAAEKQAEAQAALASVNALQEELGKASRNYDDAMAAKRDAEAKRDAAQERLDEVSVQIADLQQRLGSRANSMYRSGSTSFVDLLMGATSFAQFATNWDLLVSINESDAELVRQTKELRAEAEVQRSEYAEQERIAAEKADEAKRIQDDTAATMSAMKATYDNLSAEAAELLAQERAAKEAADAAAAAAVVQAAAEQAGGSGSNSGPDAPSPAPTPDPGYDAGAGGSIVARAQSQLGKPYGYDDPSYGAGPTSFDCSGFVSYCLTGSYTRLGSTGTFMGWQKVSVPQPGDIAVNAGHCGIYIGNNQMIHASDYGVGVITGPVQGGMIFVRY